MQFIMMSQPLFHAKYEGKNLMLKFCVFIFHLSPDLTQRTESTKHVIGVLLMLVDSFLHCFYW